MEISQVDNTIDQVKNALVRDFIIFGSYDSMTRRTFRVMRTIGFILIIFFNIWLIASSIVGFVINRDSNLHWYFLNGLYGYGYVGIILNGIYFLAGSACVLHILVFLLNERRATLTLITDMKEMYQRLPNATIQETAHFLYYLRIMLAVRNIAVTAVFIPMMIFRAAGIVLTAYQWKSYKFLAVSFLSFIGFAVIQWEDPLIHGYTHLTIAQSATYLNLRLARIQKALQDVVVFVHKSRYSSTLTNVTTSKVMDVINTQLNDLKSTLNETKQHNECIKSLLRDELILTGCQLSFVIISCLGDLDVVYKLLILVAGGCWCSALVPSFSAAANLHLMIISTSKLLHSCQTLLEKNYQVLLKSGKGLQSEQPRVADIVKTKYQILRMIHRVSSPFLKIGYTEGDGESFSPATITDFLSTVVSVTIMFLNSKSSMTKDMLSH